MALVVVAPARACTPEPARAGRKPAMGHGCVLAPRLVEYVPVAVPHDVDYLLPGNQTQLAARLGKAANDRKCMAPSLVVIWVCRIRQRSRTTPSRVVQPIGTALLVGGRGRGYLIMEGEQVQMDESHSRIMQGTCGWPGRTKGFIPGPDRPVRSLQASSLHPVTVDLCRVSIHDRRCSPTYRGSADLSHGRSGISHLAVSGARDLPPRLPPTPRIREAPWPGPEDGCLPWPAYGKHPFAVPGGVLPQGCP